MSYRELCEGIWDMPAKGEFTKDIEAHYRTMLYDLDLITYDNCLAEINKVNFRKSMGSMAMAMPSLAMIDKYRTREISYNLHLTARDMCHPNLDNQADAYNSETIRWAHQAIAAGFHRLVTGRNMFDDKLRSSVEKLIRRCEQNKACGQNLYAVDTVSGRYDMYTNLLSMLAFKLNDLHFGTDYGRCIEPMLAGLAAKLKDPETGLFYEYYQTGSFGYAMEELSESTFWTVKALKAGPNALSISLYHLFKPMEAESMWIAFKEAFGDKLLQMTVDKSRPQSAASYITELGINTEDLFAALLCAKEMKDREFFEALLAHIYDLVRPEHIETKVFYNGLETKINGKDSSGDGPACVYFSLLAQVHAGWKEIFDFQWEDQYDLDYNKIR